MLRKLRRLRMTRMTSARILAPAGSPEALTAAVRCGADAVYFGLSRFNARQNAENFSMETLAETVAYCHARGVETLITVNTLLGDGELDDAAKLLYAIAESGADGVILQDLAAAALAREICPTLSRHASTQMAAHNTAGVQELTRMGFSTVVLARELTLDEIRRIRAGTDAELETFVHGAHCMSASGCCYLSATLGGRSGNRGLCAQPCRLPFACNGHDYALSLKDMCLFSHIGELTSAGITRLKIEGRMKRPEYVAAAVAAAVAARDGRPFDTETLRAVFSRSGFTDGYLTGRRTRAMFGVRTREDAERARDVLAHLRESYRRECPRVPVSLSLTVRHGRPAELCVSCDAQTVCVTGDVPQCAERAGVTQESLERLLEKTGNTPYLAVSVHAEPEPGLYLSAASVNAMRRDVLEELTALRGAPPQRVCTPAVLSAPTPHTPHATVSLRLRFETAEQAFFPPESEYVTLPVGELMRQPALLSAHADTLIGELPYLVYPGDEDALCALLLSLKAQGLRHVSCDNIGTLRIGREAGLSVHGGMGLNIFNTRALTAYAEAGVCDAMLSPELGRAAVAALGGRTARGILGYGRLPLMQLRCCPARGDTGCGACPGSALLTDRTGAAFPLLCRDKRFSTMFNSVPHYRMDQPLPPADFIMLLFSDESPALCRARYQQALAHAAADFPMTRGLFQRGVQ